MRASKSLLSCLVLAVGALAMAGCNGDQSRMAGQGVVPPVIPDPIANVTVQSNRTKMNAGDPGKWAIITVTATDPRNGSSLPDGTPVLLSTDVGNFNSPSGPQELEDLVLFGGAAKAHFFAPTEPGLATIAAVVDGGYGQVRITITCPEGGCVPDGGFF